ncbi:MAG: hypothetical protein JSS69_01300 [Acidobacteria bacterium]|nr:hypothetical protein [Acidobacteriota bacterium]
MQKIEVVHPLPYGDEGKLYTISKPGFMYPGEFGSLEEIDARNLVIHSFDGRRHEVCGRLKQGHWEAREDACTNYLRLVGVHRLSNKAEAESGDAQYMLVIFEFSGVCGSSDSTGFAQVWKLSERRLGVEQQIDYNTHFNDGVKFQEFSPRSRRLVVRSSHYLFNDAHCCISAYDELTFHWIGSEYALERIETKRINRAARAK